MSAAACSSWGQGRLSRSGPSAGHAVALLSFPLQNVTALPRCWHLFHPKVGCAAAGWHGCPCVPSPEVAQPLSPCGVGVTLSVQRRQLWRCQGEHLC